MNYVNEVWLSLVERCVRDAEAAGSTPVTSTKIMIFIAETSKINNIRFYTSA